jgi:metal-responsive CopG/Arc/MetJ family transcriptional regulator
MTLDTELVDAVDRAAHRLGTTRSAFARRALRDALKQVQLSVLEEKQRRGYSRRPVRRGEFDSWESEQVWTD